MMDHSQRSPDAGSDIVKALAINDCQAAVWNH